MSLCVDRDGSSCGRVGDSGRIGDCGCVEDCGCNVVVEGSDKDGKDHRFYAVHHICIVVAVSILLNNPDSGAAHPVSFISS